MPQFSRGSADIAGVSPTDGRGRTYAHEVLFHDTAFAPESVTTLNFTTPPWGYHYSHGFANLSLLFGVGLGEPNEHGLSVLTGDFNDSYVYNRTTGEVITTHPYGSLFDVGSSGGENHTEGVIRGVPVRSNPETTAPLLYYFFQEWEAISKHSGNSMGGSMVNVSGYGFDPQSLSYTCRFMAGPHLFDGTFSDDQAPLPGTDLISSATMVPNDRADDWNPTTIICRTPNWGALYPSMDTRVSIFEGPVELEFRGEPPLPLPEALRETYHNRTTYRELPIFTFTEARWIEVAADNQLGSKGGDVIVFTASGLDFTEEHLYKCVFRDMTPGSGNVKNSSDATAASPTRVSCQTPRWGDTMVATRVSVQLYERGELVEHHHKQRVTVFDEAHSGGDEQNDRVGHRDYGVEWEFYEVFDSIIAHPSDGYSPPLPASSAGGSAFGNEVVNLRVYGLDLEASYGLIWDDQAGTAMISHAAAPLSNDRIEFVSPPWGNFYSFGVVELRMVRDPNDAIRNRVIDVGAAESPGVDELARSPLRNFPTIPYRFIHDWNRVNLTAAPATGGPFLGIYGAGFDFAETTHRYQCLWTGYNPESGTNARASSLARPVFRDSNVDPVPASRNVDTATTDWAPGVGYTDMSTRKMSCPVPPGAKFFSLARTSVSLWYGPYDPSYACGHFPTLDHFEEGGDDNVAYPDRTCGPRGFSALYLVRHLGRLLPLAADAEAAAADGGTTPSLDEGSYLADYERNQNYGATGVTGFAAPLADARTFTFECNPDSGHGCFKVDITVDAVTPSPMIQEAQTSLVVRKWRLPLRDATVAWQKYSAAATECPVSATTPCDSFRMPMIKVWDWTKSNRLDYVDVDTTTMSSEFTMNFEMTVGVGRDRRFVINLEDEYPLLQFVSANYFNFTQPRIDRYEGSLPCTGLNPHLTTDPDTGDQLIVTDDGEPCGNQPAVGGGRSDHPPRRALREARLLPDHGAGRGRRGEHPLHSVRQRPEGQAGGPAGRRRPRGGHRSPALRNDGVRERHRAPVPRPAHRGGALEQHLRSRGGQGQHPQRALRLRPAARGIHQPQEGVQHAWRRQRRNHGHQLRPLRAARGVGLRPGGAGAGDGV